MQTKQTSKREQRRGEDYLEWGSVVVVVGCGKMVVAAVVLPLFPLPFSFMFFFVFASLFLFSSFVFRWLSPISFVPGFLVLVSVFIFSLLLFPMFSSVSFCFFSPYVSLFLSIFLRCPFPQISSMFSQFFCHPSSPLSIFSLFFSSVCSLLSIISPSFFIPFSPGPPLVFIRGRGRELGVNKKIEKSIKSRK